MKRPCVVCRIPLGNTNRTGYCTKCRHLNPDVIEKQRLTHLARRRSRKYYETHREKIKTRRAKLGPGWDSTYSKANISAAGYFELLEKQGGVCAICGTHSEKDYRGRLSVDHCHTSNVIRGLLCNRCNLMLGHSKDRPAVLRAAAAYLEQFNQRSNDSPEYARGPEPDKNIL